MDAELEKAIDRAGRRLVFAAVLGAGWQPGDSIPKAVWWEAVRLVEGSPTVREVLASAEASGV